LVATKTKVAAIYLFMFLVVSAWARLYSPNLNQFILWGIGPLMVVFYILPNINLISSWPREYFLYGSLILFSLLGIGNITDEPSFYRYLQVLFSNLFLMLIFYFSINTAKEWLLIWKTLWLSIIALIVYSYFMKPVDLGEDVYRFSGLIENSNGTATYARVGVLAALIQLEFKQTKWIKSLLIISIIGLSYAIIQTASRGNFANLVFIFTMYFGLKFMQGWKIMALGILGFFLGDIIYVLLETFLGDFYIFDRLVKFDSIDSAIEQETRIELIVIAFKLMIDYPLLGIGLNQFKSYTGGLMSHTDILDIAYQLGIIAGLTYASIYFRLAKKLIDLYNHFKKIKKISLIRIMFILLVSELIYGLSNPNWFLQLDMIVLSLLILFVSKLYQQLIAQSI